MHNKLTRRSINKVNCAFVGTNESASAVADDCHHPGIRRAQFTCGVGTICADTLLLPMYCAIAAVLLLPIDTLQRFVKTGKRHGPPTRLAPFKFS